MFQIKELFYTFVLLNTLSKFVMQSNDLMLVKLN